MAACVNFTSEGFLKRTDATTCKAYVLVSSSEYNDLSAHKSVSPAEASAAIGFGFAVVFGLGYLSTYAVGVSKRLIRKS